MIKIKQWNNATRSPSVGWIIAKHLHQVRKFAKSMLRHWTFRWRYDLTHGLFVHLESLRMFLFENETCVLEFVDFVEWNLLRALDDLLSLLSNSRCFIQETMNLRGNVQLTICSGLSFPIENTSHNGDNDRRERYNSSYTIMPAVKLRITVLYTFTMATVCT